MRDTREFRYRVYPYVDRSIIASPLNETGMPMMTAGTAELFQRISMELQ